MWPVGLDEYATGNGAGAEDLRIGRLGGSSTPSSLQARYSGSARGHE